MTRRQLVMSLLLTGILAACRSERRLEPPEIRYGRDVCVECGMIISDPRFAAAAATRDGKTYIFDDIGDLLVYQQKHNPEWAAIWVNDFESQTWLEAEDAWYVRSPELRTPMDWGLAAFATEEAAKRRAQELGGEVLRGSELLCRPLEHPHR